MLDQQDKKDISGIIDASINGLAEKVLKPAFDGVDNRFDKVESRLDGVENEVKDLRDTLQIQYPDKSYLTDKLGDLAAEIGFKINRKIEKEAKFKMKMIEILKEHNITSLEEVKELEALV